ncbi:MAG: HypC/HybG/HupF family hydrogenase formation chaperone [bacterium]
MKVTQIDGLECAAEMRGITARVRTDLVPDVKVGDYIIVHAGFAIQRLDEEDALQTLRDLDEIAALAAEEEHSSHS